MRKGLSAKALNTRIRLKPTPSSNTRRVKKRKLRRYPEVVHYPLQTNAIYNVIARSNATLTPYTKLFSMLLAQYAESHETKSLRSLEV